MSLKIQMLIRTHSDVVGTHSLDAIRNAGGAVRGAWLAWRNDVNVMALAVLAANSICLQYR